MPHQDSLDIAIMSLRNLKPGDRYIYFVGFLDEERYNGSSGHAAQIADAAYALMMEGKVLLTQRRLGPPALHSGIIDWHRGMGKGFEYIATGAHPRWTKSNITFAQLAREWKR